MEFAGEKQKIKDYFLDNIASYIDPSLIFVENKCEFCYISILQSRNLNNFCMSCHYGENIILTNKKRFSVTTLIAGSDDRLGQLYYALSDIYRFFDIMSRTDYYSVHPLTWLHYELLRTVRLIV
jgi:hypothetical protein